MFFEGLCGEISIFCGRQTTDRQTTDRRLTDGQNRLLNPASRMRARGKLYTCIHTVHDTTVMHTVLPNPLAMYMYTVNMLFPFVNGWLYLAIGHPSQGAYSCWRV